MDAERAQQIADESQYWQEILKCLQEQNEAIGDVADETASTVIALVSLASFTDDDTNAIVSTGLDAANRAMDKLQVVQQMLMDAIQLAGGRYKWLSRELDEGKS